jgi:hypothetical protein
LDRFFFFEKWSFDRKNLGKTFRRSLNNLGQTMGKILGKSWKILEKPWEIVENIGKPKGQ